MSIILLLIPVAMGLSGFFLWCLFRANKDGQFDDLESPSHKILEDDVRI
ncbi:MAG: cbb3-type cytochrome oxidase assembly protein CcoS [Bdellovibrionales bacterium]|nr:cbb3-type cytochrome oxidase assembly protein CcoS [Bdellovibrionales bacterium]